MFDKFRHTPGYKTTDMSQRLEISNLENREFTLFVLYCIVLYWYCIQTAKIKTLISPTGSGADLHLLLFDFLHMQK